MISALPPTLEALDAHSADALVFGIFEDVRPFRGAADLVDWRTAGRLSRLALDAFVTGRWLEAFLMPGRPQLAFGKVLVLGLGPVKDFDQSRAEESARAVARILADLGVESALVELPGRSADKLQPEAAVALALATFGTFGSEGAKDSLRLFDGDRARTLLEAHAEAERMRRRIP